MTRRVESPNEKEITTTKRAKGSKLSCIKKVFCFQLPSKSPPSETPKQELSNPKSTNIMSTIRLDCPAFRASQVKFTDSLTMHLMVTSKDLDMVAFSVDKMDDTGNECRKVTVTNKDLLDMISEGKKFQPTVVSKESKEHLNGLWMQVSSTIGYEELQKIRLHKQISTNPQKVPIVLSLAKYSSLVPTSILAGIILALPLVDSSFLFDPSLYPSSSSFFLKVLLWTSFVALAALSYTVNEIIALKSKKNAKEMQDFMVELKVVLEQWSAPRLPFKSSRVSSASSPQEPKRLAKSTKRSFQGSNQDFQSKSMTRESGSSSTEESAGPEIDYPIRYLRAAKGDPIHGRKRYEDTMAWRKKEQIDTIINEPFIYFDLVKKNYPHYYHMRGKNNEVVYYDFPAKINLKVIRGAGMKMEDLLRYYMLVTEYQWRKLDPSEEGKNITVIDLQGFRLMDFVGEVVDFVKKTSAFTAAHYPERSGTIVVVNVPSWFNIIWKVLSPMADEATKKKIRIVRGKKNILRELLNVIDIENIPPEYGGSSVPLGQSPEEKKFDEDMKENLRNANMSPVRIP